MCKHTIFFFLGHQGPTLDSIISLSNREISQQTEDNRTNGSSRSGESYHTRYARDEIIFQVLSWVRPFLNSKPECNLCFYNPITFSISSWCINLPFLSLLQTPSIKIFKRRYAFEAATLLGNWMLNLCLDCVYIRSCSARLPLQNDPLISNLSSALPSSLVRARMGLAARKRLRSKQRVSYGLIRDEGLL